MKNVSHHAHSGAPIRFPGGRVVMHPCTFAGALISPDGKMIQKHDVLAAGLKAFGIDAARAQMSSCARERLEELSIAYFKQGGLNAVQQSELTAITQAVQQVQQ
jgi:hypothetical protein